MTQDPKQIVTPHAFKVHPKLLGLPLATPKRRLFALLIDLLVASILAALGAFILALTVTILFFWLATQVKSSTWWKNLIRYSAAGLASIFIFGITYYFTDNDSEPTKPMVNINDQPVATAENIDLNDLSGALKGTDFTNEESLNKLGDRIEQLIAPPTNENNINPAMFNPEFSTKLIKLKEALATNDTLGIDSLRTELVYVLASTEINSEKDKTKKARSQIKNLQDENYDLKDQIENPTFKRILAAIAEDVGLRFGWIGIYFIICLPVFKGQTLGKKLLRLKVIRLNNKPIGIWYSFERFGGYAAGIATGLLGFFQVFWDPNRQGIHDKIAGTVVIDTRESKKQKYAALREEILSSENLTD